MIPLTCANTRTGHPFATDFTTYPMPLPAQSSNARQEMDLQQLRDSSRPPSDPADYTLPLKSVADNARLAKLDAEIESLSYSDFLRFDPLIAPMLQEQRRHSLMVTREAVQDFLNDGLCPQKTSECKALAIFLLTNKLFGALTWLVIRSGGDMLDLQHSELGNEGAGRVAEWARTIPFKTHLDLSNNGIDAVGAGLLAEALEADTIAEFDLGLNPLGDEGVQLLCAGLSRNSSMQSLMLNGVGAAGAGIKAIAGVLDTHPSLSRLDLDSNAFDDSAAKTFAAALGDNKRLTSLSINHTVATDAGLSMLVDALKINTTLKAMRVSVSEPKPGQLPVALAEALTVNRTLTCLEASFGVITNDAARVLVEAVAKNTALRTFDCHLAAYGLTKQNAAALEQIKDKVEANALIEAAGNALADLSQMPEWIVPIPPEVGRSIAAFVAQAGVDEKRKETMRAIIKAGPVGLTNQYE